MYEKLSQIAQTLGLVLFVVAFVLVLVYALNPRNRKKFEDAGRIPLKDGEDQ
jgi:cytochrome c oxidase cbb3-type subunit 4